MGEASGMGETGGMGAGRGRRMLRKIAPRGAYDDALGELGSSAEGKATGSRPGGWGLTLADCAFALATLAVAAVVLVATWSPAVPSDASDGPDATAPASTLVAVVQNTEGFYQVLPLDADATVTVASSYGTNVVEVAQGRVRCSESDCANQVCVDTGWVASVGQMVVCLPHRLTVEVVADAADATPLV